ncbi:putative multi-domain containing protein [Aduncisulcus paluster]|uniref:Multi-domain containing protein n=1 Tax=Aduncisulcus paluster TaxID=2918883 RepID=A0ABQ5K0V3_9EUKA|nr:putative multi-domain containing protein [Aduncisulcus paluster]
MLNDRHYQVSSKSLTMDLAKFMTIPDIYPLITLRKNPKTGLEEKLVVFYEDELKGARIKALASELSSKGAKHGIIVYNSAKSVALNLADKTAGVQLETFQRKELLVNITHHILVPKHELLSEEEKATLLKHYSVKETQIPRIMKTDPVAKYLGLKVGDVVRITRPSETAGRYVSYRIVQ